MTRTGRSRAVALSLALALLLTACSGDDEATSEGAPSGGGRPASTAGKTAAPASAGDPCTMLTGEQIKTATGLGVVSSKRTKPSPGDSAIDKCDWELSGDDFETIRLGAFPPAQAQAYFDADKEGMLPVPGIGTNARWDDKLSALSVIKADLAFDLIVLIDPKEKRRPAAETLARNVLANRG